MSRQNLWLGTIVQCVATACLGLAHAQPSVAPAGQSDLSRLVDLAAQRLHVNLTYDAAALKGSVTLRLEAPLSDEELWTLVNRILAERGFTTVRAAGGFAVVKLAEAPGMAPVGGERPAGGPLPGFASVVVRAQHRSPKEITDALSKVLSKPGGTAVPLGESGLILISDLSARIDQALEVVKLVDVAAGPTTVEEIPVSNLSAQALATLITQVSAKRDAVSGEKVPGDVVPSPNGNAVLVVAPSSGIAYWKDLAASLDKRERVEAATYAPRSFGVKEVAKLVEQAVKDQPGALADDRWRLVADELTGTLIITATPSQHEQIKALMTRLDATPAAARRPVRSFVIKNRPVREIQSILDQMVSTGVIGTAPDASRSAGAQAGAPSAPSGTVAWPPPATPGSAASQPSSVPAPTLGTAIQPTSPGYRTSPSSSILADHPVDPPVRLSSDDGTNTLIAMGEPRVLAQIESLLVSLDVRQPQVMLEVLIVSLSDSQTLDLGVELEKQISSGDVTGRLASLFGLGTRGANGDRTVGDGNGFTGLVLSPGDFSIVLRALQTINKGRSLSMPRLLAANNQQATLDSILTQPYASTNASNTVTTTSFGGNQDAGTQVTLKPQIGAGDQLNLEYSISLSAFVGAAASPNLPPPRQQNKVQSAASLPDGYTVAVGGIELNSEGQGTSQVPGIGSIPILGEAFKNRSKNASRSRFYVFIRANVLRNQSYEDLKYLSSLAAQNAGIDDGFPEVEPLVIR